MSCLVRPAAEEYAVIRRKDAYRRVKDRPDTGTRMRAPGPPARISPTRDGWRA